MWFSFLGHLSHSGGLLLWVGVRRLPASGMRLLLTSQKLLGQSLSNLVCNLFNCKFRNSPLQWEVFWGKKCKIDVFPKIFFSTPRHGSHLISTYSNDDQGRVYVNYKFHDPLVRGSYARVLPYKSCSENALFLEKSSSLVLGIN